MRSALKKVHLFITLLGVVTTCPKSALAMQKDGEPEGPSGSAARVDASTPVLHEGEDALGYRFYRDNAGFTGKIYPSRYSKTDRDSQCYIEGWHAENTASVHSFLTLLQERYDIRKFNLIIKGAYVDWGVLVPGFNSLLIDFAEGHAPVMVGDLPPRGRAHSLSYFSLIFTTQNSPMPTPELVALAEETFLKIAHQSNWVSEGYVSLRVLDTSRAGTCGWGFSNSPLGTPGFAPFRFQDQFFFLRRLGSVVPGVTKYEGRSGFRGEIGRNSCSMIGWCAENKENVRDFLELAQRGPVFKEQTLYIQGNYVDWSMLRPGFRKLKVTFTNEHAPVMVGALPSLGQARPLAGLSLIFDATSQGLTPGLRALAEESFMKIVSTSGWVDLARTKLHLRLQDYAPIGFNGWRFQHPKSKESHFEFENFSLAFLKDIEAAQKSARAMEPRLYVLWPGRSSLIEGLRAIVAAEHLSEEEARAVAEAGVRMVVNTLPLIMNTLPYVFYLGALSRFR